MATVYLGLGSNVGDRARYIHDAVKLLDAAGIKAVELSTVIETIPVGGPPQGLFFNAVLRAETTLLPLDVLMAGQGVEAALGRVRLIKNGPRTIDIDILLYDNIEMNTPALIIPHPRMHARDFVMRPLNEVRG